jgi:glycosyltransferase involved in cell wall biosynthesis
MLRECLESIVQQKTTFPFEVIIGDDASTDGKTTEIVRQYANAYPTMIHAVIREKNIGASDNYFDLVQKTSGKYLAHIDGDDLMLPGKLERQARVLEDYADVNIVTHAVDEIKQDRAIKIINRESGIDFFKAERLLHKGCFFVHSSKMYRREKIKTWYANDFVVDYYLHLEHAEGGLIAYINEPLGAYRHHGGGISKQRKFKKIIEDAYDRAFSYALELGFDSLLVNSGRIRHNQAVALSALDAGDIGSFLKYAKIDKRYKRGSNFRQILISWAGSSIILAKLARAVIRMRKTL